MSAITDFVFKKNQLQQNAGQNTMDNIFKVAGLGKDIWNTLNTNAQEEKKNTWQNQNDAYRTALEQRLIDYKNLHPEKTAEQRTAEWFQTPDGKAYLQAGYSREDAVALQKHKYTMAEESLRAGRTNAKDKADMYKAADERIDAMTGQGSGFMKQIQNPDGSFRFVIDPSAISQIKDALYTWAQTSYPENVQELNDYYNKVLEQRMGIGGEGAGKGGPGVVSPNSASGAPIKQDISGQLGTVFSTIQKISSVRGSTQARTSVQGNLANEAKAQLSDIAQQLPGSEAAAIATQLAQPGTWDPVKLKQIQARLQAIYEASRKGAGAKQLLK
jgi:hypothetical protein